MKKLRFLLIPVTTALWVVFFYYGFVFLFIFTRSIFYWETLWIITLFLYGIIFFVAYVIPKFVRLLIFKVYSENWFARILHSLGGLYAIVTVIRLYFLRLPKIYVDDKYYFPLLGWWKIDSVKTVFLSIPALAIVGWLIWAGIVVPLLPFNKERF